MNDDDESTIHSIPHWRLVFHTSPLTPHLKSHSYAGLGTSEKPYLVDFLPIDPGNPTQLPTRVRWFIAGLNALGTLVLAFASSAYTSSVPDLETRLNVKFETAFLGTSVFVLGFALGPLLWAPLSESFGRRPVFLITYGAFVLCSGVAAYAADISIWIIIGARALGGALGSSSLVNSSTVIADMFSMAERGRVSAAFNAAPFLGPVLGPIVGGFLSESAGWTGVGWLITGMAALVWVVYLLFVPETYAPVLLRIRARRLTELHAPTKKMRDVVMHNHYRSRLDHLKGQKKLGEVLRTAMVRPFLLLFSETIVSVLAIYMAIIFGTIYLLFAAFPIVFQQGFGFSRGVSGLAFLGIAVGMILALLFMLVQNKAYLKLAKASPGGRAPAEARLGPAQFGAVMAPLGLLVFAITNSADYFFFIMPILGTVPFGFGMVVISLSLLNYLVDTYTVYAASAIAAATVVRSIFAAVFPLFTRIMFAKLGVHLGAGVPALLAALCIPFPFFFAKYGAGIREKAKFATEARNLAKQLMAGQAVGAPKQDDTKEKESDTKEMISEKDEKDIADFKMSSRPLSVMHGPTSAGEWQCYGKYCLGCSTDEDGILTCRNERLYEKMWI